MTNDEARRNDRIRIISTSRSRLRHSGFDIPSSFVIRTPSFRAEGAVTIIELLVVIIIILILAGLILSISSYVQNKGARARAETEIAAMSAALESYKADNGIYPGNNDTNSLDPTVDVNSSPPTSGTNNYSKASLYLYEQLAGSHRVFAQKLLPVDPTTLSHRTCFLQKIGLRTSWELVIRLGIFTVIPLRKTRYSIPRATPQRLVTILLTICGALPAIFLGLL